MVNCPTLTLAASTWLTKASEATKFSSTSKLYYYYVDVHIAIHIVICIALDPFPNSINALSNRHIDWFNGRASAIPSNHWRPYERIIFRSIIVITVQIVLWKTGMIGRDWVGVQRQWETWNVHVYVHTGLLFLELFVRLSVYFVRALQLKLVCDLWQLSNNSLRICIIVVMYSVPSMPATDF